MTSVIPIMVATKLDPTDPVNLPDSPSHWSVAPASAKQVNHGKAIPKIEVSSFSIRKSTISGSCHKSQGLLIGQLGNCLLSLVNERL